MANIHAEETHISRTPACESCGGATRIYGIEPHSRYAHTDIHTYVCDACDTNQVVVVPLPGKLMA